MFRNRIIIVLVIVVVFLILLIVVGKKQGWFGGGNGIKVAIEKAEKRDIIERVSASGKVYPEVELKLSPDVSGEIIELYIEEGDTVKKGEVLAKIKPDIYQAFLDRAVAALNTSKANHLQAKASLTQVKAEYDKAEKNFNRNKELHDKKVISEAEWEIIESAFKSAKAALEGAEMNVEAAAFQVQSAEAGVKEASEDLRKTTIYAPMDGVITSLLKEKGERVVGTTQFEGTDMLHIADLNAIETQVEVSENDVLRVNVGDTSEIKLDAYPDKIFKGVVTQIANSANSNLSLTVGGAEQVTNFVVKILLLPISYSDLLQNSAGRSPFLSGMSASVDILTTKVSDVITVPIQSVTTREDSTGADSTSSKKTTDEKEQEVVFVYENGKVKSVPVTTGIQDDEFIEIKKGLHEGDEVVSYPYGAISRSLKDGSSVEVTDKEKLFGQEQE